MAGYFAPWSRQNTWVNRVAINNIRKSNTPEVRRLTVLSVFVICLRGGSFGPSARPAGQGPGGRDIHVHMLPEYSGYVSRIFWYMFVVHIMPAWRVLPLACLARSIRGSPAQRCVYYFRA